MQLSGPWGTRQKPMTVTELAGELKNLVESRFMQVCVQGEISNFRQSSAGHLYFSLKDSSAVVSAVMFVRQAFGLRFVPADGMKVVLYGRMSLYEARGQCQLICSRMDKIGAGELALAFEALKAKLSAEGLFDAARKRQIPLLPKCVGVVTSPGGAAVRDFIRILHARFPAHILIAPALVQGASAPGELIRGLKLLEKSRLADVIVLTRGGGSLEDLWAFNDEKLARAIAACSVPVISAVGHEIDFTISDFAADLRCATPSDAARQVMPDLSDLLQMIRSHYERLVMLEEQRIVLKRARLQSLKGRLGNPGTLISGEKLRLFGAYSTLRNSAAARLTTGRTSLLELSRRLHAADPKFRLQQNASRLASLKIRLSMAVRENQRRLKLNAEHLFSRLRGTALRAEIQARRVRFESLGIRLRQAILSDLSGRKKAAAGRAERLIALSPFSVLSRGYSLTFGEGGKILYSGSEIKPGDVIHVTLSDRSRLKARVESADPPLDEESGLQCQAALPAGGDKSEEKRKFPM